MKGTSSRDNGKAPDGAATTSMLTGTELAKRFRGLVRRWRQETAHWNVAARKAQHEAYREIVQMGLPAVPLLLAELRRRPGHWFLALQEITGADPVAEECDGDVAAMARAWIEWGESQGYPSDAQAPKSQEKAPPAVPEAAGKQLPHR